MQLQKGIMNDGIDFLTLDKMEIKEFGKKNHSLKSRCKQKNYTIKIVTLCMTHCFRMQCSNSYTIKCECFIVCNDLFSFNPCLFTWYSL